MCVDQFAHIKDRIPVLYFGIRTQIKAIPRFHGQSLRCWVMIFDVIENPNTFNQAVDTSIVTVQTDEAVIADLSVC